jgi:hypothetical protein
MLSLCLVTSNVPSMSATCDVDFSPITTFFVTFQIGNSAQPGFADGVSNSEYINIPG